MSIITSQFIEASLYRACVFALLGCFITTASSENRSSSSIQSLKEIRERNVVMQRWETSCAAAALATVLTYRFQDPVSERYAAVKMLEKTDAARVKARGGFSLLDMKRFAEDRGYGAEAYQHLSFDDLRLFRAPIVPIGTYGANHYVVVNAVNGDHVMIADPAFGNRTIPVDRFKEMWVDGLAFIISAKSSKVEL